MAVMPLVTRFVSDNGGWADICYSSLTAENADQAIDDEVEHFKELGREFEWTVFSMDTPADLKERLASRGFSIGEREAIMLYDLEDGVKPFLSDIRVVTVENLDQLDDYRKVVEGAFGNSRDRSYAELATALDEGSTHQRAYVAYFDDVPVSAGRLYATEGQAFGGLYGGGTLPAYRGKGFYRAVVGARALDAQRSGARYLRVDAMPTSRPILERMGFVHVADSWPCEHS